MSEAHTEDGYLRIANTLMEAVLRHGFSKIQLLVLLCVIRKTYGWGKKMDEISLSQIAELTGLNQSNISRAINDLTKAGVLLKQQGHHAQAIGINKKYGEWRGLLKQQGVVKSTSRGCQNNNLPIVKTTTTKDTPKDTTKRNIDQKKKSDELENLFSKFWGMYPRKIGRANALKVWMKIKPDAELTKTIVKEVASRTVDDPQWFKCVESGDLSYIPHPTTYLNQQRWTDEW